MADKKPVGYATISAAGEHGTRLDELMAVRRVLSRILDDEKTLARDIASVSRRYLEVSQEIAELKEIERAIAGEAEVSNNVVSAESKFRPEAI